MSVYKGYDPALTGGVAIADSVRAASTTWSSQKIGTELDKKAENATFEAHTGDTDIHIIAQERETWNEKQDKKTSLAGYGIEDAYTKDEVDAKIASTYKPAGTVADLASLPAASEAKRGYVYNVASAFTTTADFLEGAGKSYPAGTNVAIVIKDDSDPQHIIYGYDAQAGFYDMSGFARTEDIQDDLDKAHEHENKTNVLDKLAVNASGKLTLDGEVVGEAADVDDALSDTSEKPVQNKVVKEALDDKVSSGDFIQLLKENTDDALSDTSEKPVQNKVVKEALNGKQDTLTIDNALSGTSENPVQNKVIKEALDARYTKTEIDAKLSSTYKAAGSVATIAALPAADAAHLGYVYNVEAAFTSTANFKEGTGKSYPAGSNVAIVLDGANYKYDVLAGFIDQSAFAPASHVSDTTKHITEDERTAWNGKADKATTLAGYGITDAAPSSHVSDTTKHITAAERTAWNNKLGSVPVASSTNLGGVKVGNGLKAKSDGTLGQVEPTIVNVTDLFEFEEGITGVFDTTFKSLVLGNIIMLTFRADTMNAILEPEGRLNIFLNIKEPYRSRLKGRFAGTARINTEGENGGNLVTGIVVGGSNASHYPGKIYCSTPRENGGNKLTSVTFTVIGFMSDPA